MIEELEKREDLIVDDVAIYDTFYENQDLIDEKGQFERGKIDCAVFTSASTVKGFVAATEVLDYTKVLAACIGKQTQEEVDNPVFKPVKGECDGQPYHVAYPLAPYEVAVFAFN